MTFILVKTYALKVLGTDLPHLKKKIKVFPARFELATFRVLGGRDNHYTTETTVYKKGRVRGIIGILSLGRIRIFIPLLWYKGWGVDGTPPRSF